MTKAENEPKKGGFMHGAHAICTHQMQPVITKSRAPFEPSVREEMCKKSVKGIEMVEIYQQSFQNIKHETQVNVEELDVM
jgi:hypothetical protein